MKTMGAPGYLKGSIVAAFESQRRKEMEEKLISYGATPIVSPALDRIYFDGGSDWEKFSESFSKGQVHALVLETAQGFQSLVDTCRTHQLDFFNLIAQCTLVCRGPKTEKAVQSAGMKNFISVPMPATRKQTLKLLRDKGLLMNRTIAIQEQGDADKSFFQECAQNGAAVIPLRLYDLVLTENVTQLISVINKIINRQIDVVMFTNAGHVDAVMSVARKQGLTNRLLDSLRRTNIASVGPSCTARLRKYQIEPDLESSQPKMDVLISEASLKLTEKKITLPAFKNIKLMRPQESPPEDPLNGSLFMKASRQEPTARTPIWLMRQAGRYMKEYRDIRKNFNFLDLCKNSDLCAQITVDAVRKLQVDAAIIFSDLLVIVEPMGFDLSYGKDQGPLISNPFRGEPDLSRINSFAPEEKLSYVLEAIKKARKTLPADIPLIGFAGCPFTMAAYLIEGKGSKSFSNAKSLMRNNENLWNSLLKKIVDATSDYLNAQIQAGVQAVQIFDSWIGCLTPEDYDRYVFHHTKNLITRIKPGVPVISFGTQTGGFLNLFKNAGGDVIGVDWRIELDEAWKIIGDRAIMGNLDPVVLMSDVSEIERQAQRILNQAAGRPGHIFNLGHGVLPETPVEHVIALVEYVKKYSQRKA